MIPPQGLPAMISRHVAARTATAALCILLILPLSARGDLKGQLDEILHLIREKNYLTALEDLKFIVQQIQDLRLAEVQPLYPEAPEGWLAEAPLRTSSEDDFWSRRLEVRRKYLPSEGAGKVEIIFDFYSPLLPAVTMSLNPVYIAGDPLSEAVKMGGFPGRLQFNPDTGEGELLLVLEEPVLLSIVGRGIKGQSVLREFASLIDLDALTAFTSP